jgi:hypothetical protein
VLYGGAKLDGPVGGRLVIPEPDVAAMPSPEPDIIQCNTCGTSFPADDAEQMAAHEGHSLVHIEQG